jgi:D-alanine-D-alanine ligase
VALTRGADVPIDFEPPYIVKPVASASSAGIHADSLVKTRAGVRRLASRIWRRFQQPAICEQFIVGRELRVGIVDDAVTGVAEWKFSDGWGFKTEAIRGNARVRRARNVGRDAAQLTRGTMGSLVTIARRSVRALGVSGYATIDLRVDSEERLHVLELNANPGLWMHGLVWSRPGFDANIRRVVEVALRRG